MKPRATSAAFFLAIVSGLSVMPVAAKAAFAAQEEPGYRSATVCAECHAEIYRA